jgi:hypothetical protein
VNISIGVDHFAKTNAQLREVLMEGLILTHLIVGELAGGNLEESRGSAPIFESPARDACGDW